MFFEEQTTLGGIFKIDILLLESPSSFIGPLVTKFQPQSAWSAGLEILYILGAPLRAKKNSGAKKNKKEGNEKRRKREKRKERRKGVKRKERRKREKRKERRKKKPKRG